MERTDIVDVLIKDFVFLRQRQGATPERIAETQLLYALITGKNQVNGLKRLLLKHRPVDQVEWDCMQNILGLTSFVHVRDVMYMRRADAKLHRGISESVHIRKEKAAFTAVAESLSDTILASPELTATAKLAIASPNPKIHRIERIITRIDDELSEIRQLLGEIKAQYS